MRKSIFICSLLCSLTTFSCGTSSDEIHRITAENTQLKEANVALSAALEQCKSELETLKNNSIKTGPSTVKGKEVLGKWNVAFSFEPNKYFTIEIIKENGKYQSKLEFSDSDKVKIEQLEKDGDKLYVVESKTQEYYRIIDGNLHLYDKDGDFTIGAGYKVTKIK